MIKIAVLVSGRGSNLQAIIDAVESKELDAKIAVVISDKEDAYALERARSHKIDSIFIDPKKFKTGEEFDRKIIEYLKKYNVDLILLAGYMRILTPEFVRTYKNRIMNIHPALLPSFPGLHAQKQALDHGVKISGCTVHFVDEEVDHGPIIIQQAVPVLENDTEESLSKRILEEEHKIYVKAVKLFIENKLRVDGRRVRVME